MSVEVDFTETNQVFQAAGIRLPWRFTWPGVLDSSHYYGLSFVPDSDRSNLQLSLLAYNRDPAGNVGIDFDVTNNAEDAVFRAAVIQAPSKF
jgi:hypothetical protein